MKSYSLLLDVNAVSSSSSSSSSSSLLIQTPTWLKVTQTIAQIILQISQTMYNLNNIYKLITITNIITITDCNFSCEP
jgi:hypothetical protein